MRKTIQRVKKQGGQSFNDLDYLYTNGRVPPRTDHGKRVAWLDDGLNDVLTTEFKDPNFIKNSVETALSQQSGFIN